MEYVHWFNHERPHGEIGMVTPVEKEAEYRHASPSTQQTSRIDQTQAPTTRSAAREDSVATDMTLAKARPETPPELLPPLSSSPTGGI